MPGTRRPRDFTSTSRAKVVTLRLFSWLGSSTLAHATLMLGAPQSDPAVPQAGEDFTLELELAGPTEVLVEDAWVLAEFRPEGAPEEREPVSVRIEEMNPGRYETEVTLPESGVWHLLLRDQTFRQEEAKAKLSFPVDAEVGCEDQLIIFPPTATGPQGIATGLIWMVVLPVAVGATVMGLRQHRREGDEVA